MTGSPKPMWSGMMQLVHRGNHPGRSSVMFLPMIDMNPSDVPCVYSTLKYVCKLARRHNVAPIITFDETTHLEVSDDYCNCQWKVN